MATIVTRAGKGSPLTNTEVDANFTNLNTDKAELSGAAFTGAITTNSTVDGVDIATRDAILTSTTTTANAALPKAGGAMSGAITTSSTFDGRNVSVDGTKLDGIEASATADQTGAQIKTAYEAETNAFTDAQFTKLGGIEALATVTNTASVTAAGALMDSELTSIASVKALNQGVATTDSPTFVNVTATSLDISGNIDVDGTTNLDVVDIDGAVDMASTLAVAGVVTANAGVVVDNITIDANQIDVSSGDLTLDVAGDIILDAAGAHVRLKKAGTQFGEFVTSSTPDHLYIKSSIQDKDMIFKGNDGGSEITALTLDMSAAGAATFNSRVSATGSANSASASHIPALLGSGSYGGGIATRDGAESGWYQQTSGADWHFYHNRTVASQTPESKKVLSFNSSGAATFSSSVASDTFQNASGNLSILATNSILMKFDSDSNQTNREFNIQSNAGDQLLKITETGAATFSSSVTTGGKLALGQTTSFPTTGLISHTNNYLYMEGGSGGIILRSASGSAQMMLITPSEVVVNNDSVDMDFRVESDANSHMLFVDAGNNRVIFGGTAQDASGTMTYNSGTGLLRHTTSAGTAKDHLLYSIAGVNNGFQTTQDTSNNITYKFHTGGNQLAATFGSEVVFNDASLDRDFRVESGANSHMLFVSGGSNRLYINGSDGHNSGDTVHLQQPDNRHGIGIVSHHSVSATGPAECVQGCFSCSTVSAGTKISIPITTQSSLWRRATVEIMVQSSEYNQTVGNRGGTAAFTFGMLSYVNGIQQLRVDGNISSITASGANIEINFTTGFVGGLSNYEGCMVYYKILSDQPDYVQVWNAVLN